LYTKNTNAKFGARYKRGVRFLCFYAKGYMSLGVHNKQDYAKERASTVYFI